MVAGKLIFTPKTGDMSLQKQGLLDPTKLLFAEVLSIHIDSTNITVEIHKDMIVINGGVIKGEFTVQLDIMNGRENKMLYCLNFYKATEESSVRLPCPSFVWRTTECVLTTKTKTKAVNDFFGFKDYEEEFSFACEETEDFSLDF